MEKQSLTHQEHGNHYIRFKVQPIELIMDMGWNFIQGNIAKYVLRAKHKNGQQDIDKAIHYCELGIDLDDKQTSLPSYISDQKIYEFLEKNKLCSFYATILFHISAKEYEKAKEYLLINEIVENYFL